MMGSLSFRPPIAVPVLVVTAQLHVHAPAQLAYSDNYLN